jgi:hypothetical protein
VITFKYEESTKTQTLGKNFQHEQVVGQTSRRGKKENQKDPEESNRDSSQNKKEILEEGRREREPEV